MRIVCLSFLVLISITSYAQHKDEIAIRKVLASQTADWNKGDKEAFMNGYWKNDSLLFIGKSGVNRGWQQTLDNYRKGYPDTTAMGKLNFDLLSFKRLSPGYYFVVGKWYLQRSIGDVSGHFSLLFKKINGEWKIVADHSS